MKALFGRTDWTPLMWWMTRRSTFPGFWFAIRGDFPTGSANLIILTKFKGVHYRTFLKNKMKSRKTDK